MPGMGVPLSLPTHATPNPDAQVLSVSPEFRKVDALSHAPVLSLSLTLCAMGWLQIFPILRGLKLEISSLGFES